MCLGRPPVVAVVLRALRELPPAIAAAPRIRHLAHLREREHHIVPVWIRNADTRLPQKANVKLNVIADEQGLRIVEKPFQLRPVRKNRRTIRHHRGRNAVHLLRVRPLLLGYGRIHPVHHGFARTVHHSERQHLIVTPKARRLGIKDQNFFQHAGPSFSSHFLPILHNFRYKYYTLRKIICQEIGMRCTPTNRGFSRIIYYCKSALFRLEYTYEYSSHL